MEISHRAIVTLGIFILIGLPQVLAHEDSTIEITWSGFMPNQISVHARDTITFINKDTAAHWPASDIHPSHGIYPSFDPKKAIAPGSTWRFPFDRTGTWRFHDHLAPEFTGVVQVIGNQEVTPSLSQMTISFMQQVHTLTRAVGIQSKKLYYYLFPKKLTQTLSEVNMQTQAKNENETRDWLEILGGERVMDELIHDSGGGSIVDCHQEAHHIGRIAFDLYGAYVFQAGNFSCHSGYYHGAMESFLKKQGTDNLAKNIDMLCNQFPTRFGLFECLHGVGHGVLAYLSYDVPKALEACRELSSDYAKTSCFGGVFMENIVTAQGRGAGSSHDTKWVNDDPHFPCNGVDGSFDVQYQCYLMQTSRMLDISHYDFTFVKDQCLKAPQDMMSVCFKSMGRDIAGQTLRDPKKIIEKCAIVPSIYHAICIEGALNVIMDFWGENLTDQPQALCSLLPDDDARTCFENFGIRLKDIFGSNGDAIKNRCSKTTSAHEQTCRKAAGV